MGQKESLTSVDMVKLERCLNLNLVTKFEREFLEDIKSRFFIFGSETVITEKQREVLNQIYNKWKASYNHKFLEQQPKRIL